MIKETENAIEPTKVQTSDLNNRGKKTVSDAIELIEKSIADTRRQKKIDQIKEDKSILESQGDNLISMSTTYAEFRDAPQPPLMKATLYDQLFRKIYAQNANMQKSTVKRDLRNESLVPYLTAIKEQVIEDGDLATTKKEIVKRFFDMGTVFTSIGFDDAFEQEILEYEYCFWDISATVMRKSGRALKGTVTWFATKAILSRGDFEEYLKSKKRDDLVGKVIGGDVIGTELIDTDEEIDYNDPITMYTFWSIRKGAIYRTIFAGRNAVEVELKEGKKYPHIFRKKAYIPILCYYADVKANPFFSNSYVGLIKDGAEALKKSLNSYLLSIPRSLNPWTLLVGDSSGELVEDMRLFNAISDAGGTPIISTDDPNVEMKTLTPQDLFGKFREAREIILDEVGSKIGINFRIQEKTSQRATIFIEQQKDENETTQLNKTINQRATEELLEFGVHLSVKFGDKDTTFFVAFDEDSVFESGDTEVEAEMMFSLLKEWDGYFEVDISVEEDLTTPQKIQASDNITASITNLIMTAKNMGVTNTSQIRPLIEELYNKVLLLKKEKTITRSDLFKMIEANISPAPQPEEETNKLQNVPQISESALAETELPQAIQQRI